MLVNDGKTVSVFSLWNTDSANILSKIKVGCKIYKVTTIGDNALDNSGKISLKSVTIPSTITYIWENAFADATKLKEITIKGNLKTIENGAFSGINKSAVFKIKASKTNYNKIVKKIKKSGVTKTVKFKRI